MKNANEENYLKQKTATSRYIIIYKFFFGLVEFSSGVGIGVFGKPMLHLYNRYISEELSEDPHDLLANITGQIIPNLLNHRLYLVFYLIILGGAKIAGAIGLVYGKNWGVDLLVGLTALMLPFQVAGLLLHPSLFDFLYLTIGLLIALYLINFRPKAWLERTRKDYGIRRRNN